MRQRPRQPLSRLRSLIRGLAFLASTLLLLPRTATSAEIVVEGACTLVDAIHAANTDSGAGGCPAGSGADDIVLTGDVVLTQVNNDTDGANGLPSVTSEITLEGGGFSISRDDLVAPDFRILHVSAEGTLILEQVHVAGGSVESSGGGLLTRGATTLSSSTVSDNVATGNGGGIANYGDLLVNSTTISGNTGSGYYGGGGGVVNKGSATFVNTTISGNEATGLKTGGGGLLASTSGDTVLINSTVAGNTGIPGSGILALTPTLLVNTLVGFNDCDDLGGSGGIVDGGNNFDDDGSCGDGFATLTGLDPVLADNGGPTPTHALEADSTAIDAAGICDLDLDQRGFARDDDRCDSGTFEFGASAVSLVESGSCPGDVTFSIGGATPMSFVRLYLAEATGSFELPSGQCRGTVIDLATPDVGPLLETDADGETAVTLTYTEADCGSFAQALDGDTCTKTRVVQIDGCYPLGLTHSGSGTDPVADPAGSAGCFPGDYLPGELITLTAAPDQGWGIDAWTGTDDDASRERVNSLTMPDHKHRVAVAYFDTGLVIGPVTVDPPSGPPDTVFSLSATVIDDTGVSAVTAVVRDALGNEELRQGLVPLGGDTYEGELLLTESEPGDYSIDIEAVDTKGNVIVLADATSLILDACFPLTTTHTGNGADPMAVGLGRGESWEERIVDGGFSSAYGVWSADLDGDGDLDTLGVSIASNIPITWWENVSGDGTVWSEHVIDPLFSASSTVSAADLDGDGDLDVLSASYVADSIRWWENTFGDGSVWTGHDIATGFDNAVSARATDIDDDGDLDVLGAASVADDVTWWENDGSGSTWTPHLVDGGFDGVEFASTADVDGDGDLDVIAAALGARQLAWWDNLLGDGTTWNKTTIATIGGAWTIAGGDIDGDGDTDVVSGAENSDGVIWWENTNGDGSLWFKRRLDVSIDAPRTVATADLDGDGSLDLVAAGFGEDAVKWWANTAGGGLVWEEHVVDGAFTSPQEVHVVDLDHDGALDIVGGGGFGISWWRNTYEGTCDAEHFRPGDRIALTAAPDEGWAVESWTGTDDDTSTELTNELTMPEAARQVSVAYFELNPPDLSPPEITDPTVDPPSGPVGTLFTIQATITDPSGIASAVAIFRDEDGVEVLRRDMVGTAEPDRYEVVIQSIGVDPGAYTADIEAVDASPAMNVALLEDAILFTIEPPGIPCADIANFLARCRANAQGNSLQVRVTFTSTDHSGETVEISFDGAPQLVVIAGNSAQATVNGAGAGSHTIEITDPPMCRPEVTVSCP